MLSNGRVFFGFYACVEVFFCCSLCYGRMVEGFSGSISNDLSRQSSLRDILSVMHTLERDEFGGLVGEVDGFAQG